MQNLNNLDPVYGLDWTKMGGGSVIHIIQDKRCGDIVASGLVTPNGLESILKSQRQHSAWAGNLILGQPVVTREILCDCDSDTLLIMVERFGSNKAPLKSRYQSGSLQELRCNSRCDRDRCQILTVTQDAETREVQMVGVMSQEGVSKTIQTGLATFWSRSRKELWTKGEVSSNFLKVQKVMIDHQSCSVVLVTNPVGPVCHTGAITCFREPNGNLREYKKGEVTVK